MPMFALVCPRCRRTADAYAPMGETPRPGRCVGCGWTMRRKWTSPGLVRGALDWETHYNKAVGGVVETKGQFKSELSRMSDEATERTGVPHDFQPIDYREKPGVVETDES